MPRTPRHAPGGIIYHVLNRAVARIHIFKRDQDYLAFLNTLLQAHHRSPLDILAYCIMPSHWHLLLRPHRDRQLSTFMQWLTLAHAQRWRTSHDTVGYGPLYQGRFKAFPVQDDAHFLTVARYIERNPLRANLVPKAELWPWSSLHHRLHPAHPNHPPPSPWPIPTPHDWLYRLNTPQTPAEEQAIATAIHRSRPFGSPTWQTRICKRLSLPPTLRPPGRPRKHPLQTSPARR